MAVSTLDFFLKPDDGWVQVAASPNFLRVKPAVRAQWAVAMGGTAPPLQEARASGALTLTGNAGDTETVTIGSVTYTFQTVLVDAANNVLIGATASDSIDNLIAAITGGAGAGTLYGTGTAANADATAVAGAGDTMDVFAITPGAAGNAIATTETMLNGSFGGAVLSGGADAVQGLPFPDLEEDGPSTFSLDAAIATNVYIRLVGGNNNYLSDLIRFGVIRDQ